MWKVNDSGGTDVREGQRVITIVNSKLLFLPYRRLVDSQRLEEWWRRCLSSDDFIVDRFNDRKNETDFTSILSQYLCDLTDLISKSGGTSARHNLSEYC